MKKEDVRQRIESFRKMSTAGAAIFMLGLVGLACSNSGLRSGAHDAGTASGGQAGSIISSGSAGGFVGTIGSGGSNGDSGTADSSGTGGQGGTAGSPPSDGGRCGASPICNQGDQEAASAVGLPYTDLSWDCPAERECYSLDDGCGPILCAVPAGVHCDDPLSVCDPGDTLATLGECEGYPSPCYSKRLCTRSTVCRHVTDAGVDAGIDGGIDAIVIPYCGDGIIQTNLGEQCDLGPFNGVPLDSSGKPTGWGCSLCDKTCRFSWCQL